MELLYAILLGTLFGLVLQRVGAADPDKIIGMLNLTDLHLMKAIFSAIGIASALFFLCVLLGLTDTGNMSIKGMYWGVIFGGVLLGAGWAISGYCPGTGIVGAGSGRLDGVFFALGGLLGAGIFTLIFASIKDTFLFEALLGGKTSLVETGSGSTVIEGGIGPVIAIVIGIAMIVIAKVLPERFRS